MATRTWISGVGDDANPCSRTAPCKTFAGAISKTAAHGEIDALDPGGFGTVTITKSITLDGGKGSGWASILASGTNGIIINAGANDTVTLRHLSINGAGTGVCGIRILAAKAVFVEHCEIFGFKAAAGTDAGRGIRDARTAGGTLHVTNTTIRDNRQTGIVILPATGSTRITATIDNVWLQGNGNAGALGTGNGGLAVHSGSLTTISNSIVTGNTVGISVEQAAGVTECNIESCVIAHNFAGIVVQTGTPTARLSDSTVVNNTAGIQLTSGAVISYQNNRIFGNTAGNDPTAGATIDLK